MARDGNQRIRLRVSAEVRHLVVQAQGASREATAVRALLLIGAASAGLDVAGVARELALARYEPLEPAVIAALDRILGDLAAGVAASPAAGAAATPAANPAVDPAVDDQGPTGERDDTQLDLLAFGIDV